jgi:hypothetical protein
MPLPNPGKDEKQDAFVSRCMENPSMKREYQDVKQRVAVCLNQWRKAHPGAAPPPKKD